MTTEPIPFCETPQGFHAVSPDGYCHTCGKHFEDDIGPPAPGEGGEENGYPNPEIGMVC